MGVSPSRPHHSSYSDLTSKAAACLHHLAPAGCTQEAKAILDSFWKVGRALSK